MEQWEFARSTGVCAVSGRGLSEGEEYFAVLFEEGESFRRTDYSLEAWDGPPPGAFCHFKTRVPARAPAKKQLLVDSEMLVNLFLRLAEQTEPLRLQFRFVLALILMRKRLLRYEETIQDEGREYWQMRLVKEKSLHRVLNPHLTDEQTEGVSRQLSAILHGDIREELNLEEDAEAEEAGSVPEGGSSTTDGCDSAGAQDCGVDA